MITILFIPVKTESKVSAFSIFTLELDGEANPCYIINDEKNVIVANYSGGNIVFGKIMMVALGSKQVVQHYGKGRMLKDKRGPHVHIFIFLQTESLCCLMI
jgi:6-phosphogluconolactonase (cycloisomerase 2 family)